MNMETVAIIIMISGLIWSSALTIVIMIMDSKINSLKKQIKGENVKKDN